MHNWKQVICNTILLCVRSPSSFLPVYCGGGRVPWLSQQTNQVTRVATCSQPTLHLIICHLAEYKFCSWVLWDGGQVCIRPVCVLCDLFTPPPPLLYSAASQRQGQRQRHSGRREGEEGEIKTWDPSEDLGLDIIHRWHGDQTVTRWENHRCCAVWVW